MRQQRPDFHMHRQRRLKRYNHTRTDVSSLNIHKFEDLAQYTVRNLTVLQIILMP